MSPADTKNAAIKQKRANITVSRDSMSATLILRKPLPDDPPLSLDEVLSEIAAANVNYGLNKDAIEKAITEEDYNNPVTIAVGKPPKKGENATFTYHFDTSQEHKPQVDEDGRVDYKNISFIQNVEKGAVLVTKTPPTPGEPGINVYGKEIKGIDGRNIPFTQGANTQVTEDELSLIAIASGAIVYLYGKVSVNDIMVIKGDVDYSVGNISCLGSVRVTGEVKAGFELKVDGDLEVFGNVEDCNIDVKGNIMVKGGFFGKGDGLMKAGGDIYIKYIEGQRLEAGGNIYVGGEVINCHVQAGGNVVVNGRRGKIIGGEVRAVREIRASFLGAETGTQTVLAVAFDSERIKRHHEILNDLARLKDDEEKVKKALYDLYRLEIDGRLTPDKKAVMVKLEDFKKGIPQNLQDLEKEKLEIEEALKKTEGARIIALDTLYSGVRTTFGLIYRDFFEEFKECVVTLDGVKVMISDFSEKS